MIRVGFGVSVLARAIASNGGDGIGRYTACLMTQLLETGSIDLRPFGFGAKPGLIPGALDAGSFGRQLLPAYLFRRDFGHLDELARDVDLVHATDHLVPKLRNKLVIATVMDAIPLAHPEWVGYRFRRLKNHVWRTSVRWADHYLTISEFSRNEIVRWFDVPRERVSVVPLGVDPEWFEPVSEFERCRVLHSHDLPDAYFLFVGTLQPRKNLQRVIDAHRRLPERVQNQYPLVIVGRYGWGCESLRAALAQSRFGQSVRWLQRVPDADLRPILSGARALVFPSLYEGFGLPVLEAFAAGVPVVTSNTTSLPEVAGDAALLVDPFDTREIADAIRQLAEDEPLAVRLAALGRERARCFSWASTASQTLDVYRAVLAGRDLKQAAP